MERSVWNPINWLFPQVCLLCKAERLLAPPDSSLGMAKLAMCPTCQSDLLAMTRHETLSPKLASEILWLRPESWALGLDIFALLPHHQSEVRMLLYRIKYGGEPDLAYELGSWMGYVHRERWARDYDAIVPIPIAEKKRVQRGYNQAALLAEGVSEATGIPIVEGLAIGEGHGLSASQSEKDRLERLTFEDGKLRTTLGVEHIGKRFLLVDDVLTTGATLMSARACLYEVGASRVDFAILAHAKKAR